MVEGGFARCRWWAAASLGLVVPVASEGCVAPTRSVGLFGEDTEGSTATVTATDPGGGGSQTADDDGEGSSGSADSGEIKLDVGPGHGDDGGDDSSGCEKVDFLFVVDNSGSMQDEQQNLVASFPGFIGTISDTLMAQDYHIMVVDTDAESLSFSNITCTNNVCTCQPEPQCCYAICSNNGPIQINPPPQDCMGISCDEFEVPTGCPVTLGAGKAEDPLANDCGIEGGKRYMVDTQPDLVGTFECAALVGAGGDGNEKPMEAMMEAVTTQTQPGACNDGFLRDDAILVVTFITDEEDDGSVGDPALWKQTLVDAKNGNEEAIVVLGLLGDTGVPGGVCNGQADDAPKLRQFAESFTRGQWASVCEPSYNAFFEAAVSVIDTTCDEFQPEG